MNSYNFQGFPQASMPNMQMPSYGYQQPQMQSSMGPQQGMASYGSAPTPQMYAQALMAPSGTGGAMQRQAPRTGGLAAPMATGMSGMGMFGR